MTTTLVQSYPKNLEQYLTLPNKRTLRIRALHWGEEDPIRDLYAHLSQRSRYLRFLSPLPAPDPPLLRLLSSGDHRSRLALVAEHDSPAGIQVVGLVNFGAVGDRSAEVGLVVRDEWQRQRVGTILADRVLAAAEERGYYRFVAHLLPENVAIRKIVARLGNIISVTLHGGVSELVFVRRVAPELFPILR